MNLSNWKFFIASPSRILVVSLNCKKIQQIIFDLTALFIEWVLVYTKLDTIAQTLV